MKNDQGRFLLAIVLSAGVLFLWQMIYAPKNSDKSESIQQKIAEEVQEVKQEIVPAEVPAKPVFSKQIELINPKFGRLVLNDNLSVASIENPKAPFLFKEIIDSIEGLRLEIINGGTAVPLMLESVQLIGDNKLIAVNRQYNINVAISFVGFGKLHFALTSPDNYKLRLIFNSTPKTTGNNIVRQFAFLSNNDVERFNVGKTDAGEGAFKWMGIDYNYHLFATVFKNKQQARYSLTQNNNFIVEFIDAQNNFSMDLVYLQKNYDELIAYGDNLDLAVDFGIFGILAVPILRGLQFVYRFIPNYGVAIILLTLFIRLILYPLQHKSFKSMKKMQLIQPELAKIKEKYKEDPKRVQQETMALFKRAGANPLGGCLPLLLQMPVFFAYFKVLGNSVELVNAPFFGWLVDLSSKDPYYILPIIMCIVMLVQQKLTPSPSADPMQKKIMMIMPIVFGFIMKDLPSGLCLYILMSTFFGIAQQLFVYKFSK